MIYFIENAARKAIKIGKSHDTKKRLAALQCASCDPLNLIAEISGYTDEELYWHRRYSECRIKGEWFRDTEELRAQIQYRVIGDLRGYFKNPAILTAYNSDTEPWRLTRLDSVYKTFLYRIGSQDHAGSYAACQLYQLHDHKGDLTVFWLSCLLSFHERILNSCWFDEDEYNIEHKILPRLIDFSDHF